MCMVLKSQSEALFISQLPFHWMQLRSNNYGDVALGCHFTFTVTGAWGGKSVSQCEEERERERKGTEGSEPLYKCTQYYYFL